jgi:hypothetical protein
MPDRSRSRSTDVNEIAHQIAAEVAGDREPFDPDAGKDPDAVALGRKGGLRAARHGLRSSRQTNAQHPPEGQQRRRGRRTGPPLSQKPSKSCRYTCVPNLY